MRDRSAVEQLTKEHLIALALSRQERVAALSGPGGPPPFVRARVKRKQEKPTEAEVCYHAACCPDCGRALSGRTEHRRRQVIVVPLTP